MNQRPVQESVLRRLAILTVSFAISAAVQNVMLMNCIGPSVSDLYVANSNGTAERRLMPAGGFDYHASYSLSGKWITFTSERSRYGGFLQGRRTAGAKIVLVNRDGSGVEELTADMPNAGFPSWSADGKEIVYRSFGPKDMSLGIFNLQTRQTRVLTNGSDNLPYWSPKGSRILFTRSQGGNFDVYTIRPDGTDVRRVTDFPANGAHAVWSQDGKQIMWNSGEYGFKDEAALYDNSFQPYGSICIMNTDGT